MATKIRILLGDLVAAVVSSFIVTPLTQIVDVAVSQSASGQASVAGGLIQGVKSWVTQPLHMLGQPAFKLCWFVYICTYAGANMIEDICVLFLDISPVMPKFFGVTLCNMLACMYKARHPPHPTTVAACLAPAPIRADRGGLGAQDGKLAQLYGKSEEAKPFPPLGYFMFLIRDLLANGGVRPRPHPTPPHPTCNFET